MNLIVGFLATGAVSTARTDPDYFGVFVKGAKIGYQSHLERPDRLNGRPVIRTEDHVQIALSAGGPAIMVVIDWTSWTSPGGQPLRMIYDQDAGGSKRHLDARFGLNQVQVDINESGVLSHKSLEITKGTFAANPYSAMLGKAPGAETGTFYFLQPAEVTLERAEFGASYRAETELFGKKISAKETTVNLDGAPILHGYYDSSGNLLRLVDDASRTEVLPMSKAVALLNFPATYDLDEAASVESDSKLSGSGPLAELSLRISGTDLSKTPSDSFQTITKSGESWIAYIHPPKNGDSNFVDSNFVDPFRPVGLAGWESMSKPGLFVPSDNLSVIRLAKQITGKTHSQGEAAQAIRAYVFKNMHPSKTHRELRDATEILRTKQGMCGNYAILTTTLLRAAGIPSKLVGGLLTTDGTFYYHAWNEAWDGVRWVGLDSTVDDPQLSAGHLKLAEGNVEDIRKMGYFGSPKIEVIFVH